MKWSTARKKPLYIRQEQSDSRDLTKSAFELLFVIILLLFAIVLFFSVFFRIVTFERNSKSKTQTYSLVCSKSVGQLQKGMIVSADTGSSLLAGEIIGLEGESILIGDDVRETVGAVIYRNQTYTSNEELTAVLPERKIPTGYVMLDCDIALEDELCIGTLVRQKDIEGEAKFLIYPFSLFCKDPALIRKS